MAKSKGSEFLQRHPFYKKSIYISSAVLLISIGLTFIPEYFPRFIGLVGVWVGFFILLLGINSLIADLAKSKGRSWAAFFWLSILFSPLIMWIIAASVSPLPGSVSYVTPVTASSNTGSPDIAKEIEKLGSLKEQGLITKAEFDSKKKELLDRI